MTAKIGVILAAGLGKRMNSNRHKVVHEVCGKPMIAHIVDEMKAVGFDRLYVVVGRLEEQVREVLGDAVAYVRQERQDGTGHAVQQVAPYLEDDGITVVLYGDGPLLQSQDVLRLIRVAEEHGTTAVFTARVENPFGFGRIIRTADGAVERIVEEKDATAEEKLIREVNSGIYAFQTRELLPALAKLTPDNAQGELLLTDCVEYIRRDGGRVLPVVAEDPRSIASVNDRMQLAAVEKLMRERILAKHMANGVTVIDPAATYVQADVKIGRDTVLLPGTMLEGRTVVGENCAIGPNSRIVDSTLGERVEVQSSVVLESVVADGVHIGPFAYLRPGSRIGANAKIGDFVEIKNSAIGAETKVSHLSYVGDSEIGARVNIGCGVVTVNYDGVAKHKTIVGDDSFIGSNSNLVAPITVGAGAYVATGSTITDEVPEEAFAIARERQTTKLEYATKLKNKLNRKNKPDAE